MPNTHTTDAAKAKAEASFKRREAQARDGAKAMTEYIAAQAAMRAKTEKLRAMRLAKEAEDEAEDEAPVRTKRAKKAKS